jgi:hypothetical protein
MQEEFDKLSEDEQCKFIIKNILNKDKFKDIHKTIKDKYPEYIYNKKELEEILKTQKFEKYIKNLIRYLEAHTKAVENCYLNQSRYPDNVDGVYDTKDVIEMYCYSKYISSKYNGELIMNVVKNYYDDSTDTIKDYGGETYGDQDQSLRKAMKIILNSQHLDNKIKKTKEYKKYYSIFFNKEDDDYAGDDEYEEYKEYEKGKKEINEYNN